MSGRVAHQKCLFPSAYYKSSSDGCNLRVNHQLMTRKRWWEPGLPLEWRRQREQRLNLVPTSFHQPKEEPTSLCRSFDLPVRSNCNYETSGQGLRLGRAATSCWGHAGWAAFPLHDDSWSTRLGTGENEVWRCSSREHFYPGLYPAALNHLAVGVWMEQGAFHHSSCPSSHPLTAGAKLSAQGGTRGSSDQRERAQLHPEPRPDPLPGKGSRRKSEDRYFVLDVKKRHLSPFVV